jgi:hypothetical protein
VKIGILTIFIAFILLGYGCNDPQQTDEGDPQSNCYTFSSVGEICLGVQATLWGCSEGREYKWSERCFGKLDVIHDGPIVRCFAEPLQDSGECSSNSLGE